MSQNLKVTTIEELREYAKGDIIELSPFTGDKPFVARVRRPSLLKLVKDGKVPNSLKSKANELFSGQVTYSKDDEKALSELCDLLYIFADACLVEPTVKDLEEAGLQLTDEQLMELFNYSQKGMSALEKFRKKPRDIDYNKHGKNVPKNTKRDYAHK